MGNKKLNKTDYKSPRVVQDAVNISLGVQEIAEAKEFGLTITGITSSSGILYYEIPVFIGKFKVSYSTICRNIDRLRLRRDARNYFVKVGNKNYVSCGIIANRKKLTGYFSNEEYVQWLSCYHWDLIGGVSYLDSYSLTAIRKKMDGLFTKLKRKYYDKELVFFYVTEPNPTSKGYHAHFILGYQDNLTFTNVKEYIENLLRSDATVDKAITEIQEYQSDRKYLAYIVKKIHLAKTQDGYDFLASNLIN